jgi:hypothetical protein
MIRDLRDFMDKNFAQSNKSDSGDSSSQSEVSTETTEKTPPVKKWRYLNLWRDDRTEFVPGLGFMDRDSYNSIMRGGDSSPF